VVITVYQDKSFTFITKSPPASILLKKAAGITAGSKSAEQGQGRQGDAQTGFGHRQMKSKDMNANEEAAFRVIAGTARSMGIEVVG
jgi:large subunit ribosomal protein L11